MSQIASAVNGIEREKTIRIQTLPNAETPTEEVRT